MPKFSQSRLFHYGIAALSVAVMFTMTLVFGITDLTEPKVLFLVTVMISAWFGGMGPGFFAMILSILSIGYFYLPSIHTLAADLSDLAGIFIFASVALPINLICAALRRAIEELRESEELHRITLNNISDAIFLTDRKGDFTYISPNANVIFGYSTQEIKAFGNISRLLGEGWFDPRELDAAGEIANIEREITDKAGARRVTLINVKRVAFKGGRSLYTFHDVTQRKQAQVERLQRVREEAARIEAEAANRAKDEFLAMVSHELRSPLNAMLGWAKLLRGGNLDEAASAHATEVIERNARSQAQLIEELLDISRIVAGAIRLNLQTIDLAPVIEAAIDDISPAADAKAIHLCASLDPAAGLVMGDPDRLKQVVSNLLSNAVKFTPQGGSVEVRLARAEPGVRISVSDTGKGVKAEFLPHIFDRYRQEGREANMGLGLGLNIVRSLIEMHGGMAQAESCGEGQGATFTVTLPQTKTSAETAPAGDFNGTKKGRAVNSFIEKTGS